MFVSPLLLQWGLEAIKDPKAIGEKVFKSKVADINDINALGPVSAAFALSSV